MDLGRGWSAGRMRPERQFSRGLPDELPGYWNPLTNGRPPLDFLLDCNSEWPKVWLQLEAASWLVVARPTSSKSSTSSFQDLQMAGRRGLGIDCAGSGSQCSAIEHLMKRQARHASNPPVNKVNKEPPLLPLLVPEPKHSHHRTSTPSTASRFLSTSTGSLISYSAPSLVSSSTALPHSR
jgi:hypothetical protein